MPNYVFRVYEKLALRIKRDRHAIARLERCRQEGYEKHDLNAAGETT